MSFSIRVHIAHSFCHSLRAIRVVLVVVRHVMRCLPAATLVAAVVVVVVLAAAVVEGLDVHDRKPDIRKTSSTVICRTITRSWC